MPMMNRHVAAVRRPTVKCIISSATVLLISLLASNVTINSYHHRRSKSAELLFDWMRQTDLVSLIHFVRHVVRSMQCDDATNLVNDTRQHIDGTG